MKHEGPKYPLRPDVATISLNFLSAKLADVQTPDQLAGLKTASIAAGQAAIKEWKLACQAVTEARHKLVAGMRQIAGDDRRDAAELIAHAEGVEANANEIEKGIQNG